MRIKSLIIQRLNMKTLNRNLILFTTQLVNFLNLKFNCRVSVINALLNYTSIILFPQVLDIKYYSINSFFFGGLLGISENDKSCDCLLNTVVGGRSTENLLDAVKFIS